VTFRRLAVLVLSFVCTGCIPFKDYDLPAVEGVVRDDATKGPVAGARIIVNSKEKADIHSAAVSDKTGHFSVPEMTHTIWLPPLPYDLVLPDCIIQVSAAGYADRQFDFYDELGAQRALNGVSNTPEIVLKRSSQP